MSAQPAAPVQVRTRHLCGEPVPVELSAGLLGVWRDVTDAGGGVGFRPGAPTSELAGAAESLWAAVRSGRADLVVLEVSGPEPRTRLARPAGEPVAWAALVHNADAIQAHWSWVKRMQVHPLWQGLGLGGVLLDRTLQVARGRGLQQLYLTTQASSPAVRFYERHGFSLVGRMPLSLQLAPGRFDDEVYLRKDVSRDVPLNG